jgi:hypothetical protein
MINRSTGVGDKSPTTNRTNAFKNGGEIRFFEKIGFLGIGFLYSGAI